MTFSRKGKRLYVISQHELCSEWIVKIVESIIRNCLAQTKRSGKEPKTVGIFRLTSAVQRDAVSSLAHFLCSHEL